MNTLRIEYEYQKNWLTKYTKKVNGLVLEIFDSVCILLAKAEQKHFQFTKKMLDERGLGITPGQMIILYTLYKQDGESITELGKRCFLDNSTLTGLIDRLERLQLLSRVAVPGDRRAYSIYLTDAGRAIREQVTEVMESVAQPVAVTTRLRFLKKFFAIFSISFNTQLAIFCGWGINRWRNTLGPYI